MKWAGIFIMMLGAVAYPNISCPDWMHEERLASDLGMLADTVSWNDEYARIEGLDSVYNLIGEAEGIYDTRMRIYESEKGEYLISYRPTQQTPEGGNIHDQRRLVPCQFVQNCIGRVHDRFQQAFMNLLDIIGQDVLRTLQNQTIHMGSHSLGGALQLFMAVYLKEMYGTIPTTVLGFAGPFIGDYDFTEKYMQTPKNDRWWQVESVNRVNPAEYDGTVEVYNVDDGSIYIQSDSICGLLVDKLSYSYGMHDLRNYRDGLISRIRSM
jgi:hypothetical protein